jgi:hypothetical protein
MRACDGHEGDSRPNRSALSVRCVVLGPGGFLDVPLTASWIKKPGFESRAGLLRKWLARSGIVCAGCHRNGCKRHRHRGRERYGDHNQGRCGKRYRDLFEHNQPFGAPTSASRSQKGPQLKRPIPILLSPGSAVWFRERRGPQGLSSIKGLARLRAWLDPARSCGQRQSDTLVPCQPRRLRRAATPTRTSPVEATGRAAVSACRGSRSNIDPHQHKETKKRRGWTPFHRERSTRRELRQKSK